MTAGVAAVEPSPPFVAQARKRSLTAMKSRNDGIAALQALLKEACDDLALTSDDPETRKHASMWAYKIEACAGTVWIYRCPNDGALKTACSCCGLAMCPRRERRYVQRWVHRIRYLAARLKPSRGYSWKMLTIALRQRGGLSERVDAAAKMRAALARELREEYGMVAGVGALEEGEHEGENVHLHFLALSRFVPRRELQHWLQARDCTIRKCHHPHNDRCDSCKRERRGDCPHPEAMPDGRLRPRCRGSWYVDVRACYTRGRDGRIIHGSGKDAAAEVVKYACKPTMHGNPHHANEDEFRDELAHARRTVLFHLAMRGRHRVETYGEAKKIAPEEEHAADDGEPTEKGPRCPDCQGPMACVSVGARTFDGALYRWGGEAKGPAG